MTDSRILRPVAVVLCLCGLVSLLAGCGGGLKLPPVAPVSGLVTLDGQPLPRGTVQFVPDASKGNQGPTAVGAIGADGRYTLRTAGLEGAEGAMVGFHKVRVEARQEPKGPMDTLPASLIPAKYADENGSGLAFEVKAGQKNQINLELKSRP